MNADHVVFGAGAIGLATAAVLHERGEKVRMVNRSGHAPAPDGVEVVGGDAADPAFTTAVAAGARVVYQTLNPPYHRWSEEFPVPGLWNPTVRALWEMQYLFDEPFVVDSTKIAERLDLHATPVEAALERTARATGDGRP